MPASSSAAMCERLRCRSIPTEFICGPPRSGVISVRPGHSAPGTRSLGGPLLHDIKTWAMRGTLHLLLADELPVYVAAHGLLRPRYRQPAWLRYRGLTPVQAEAILDAIPRALDGQPLTREELGRQTARLAGEPGLA